MGYDRGDSFPFDFLDQMEFHLVQNRKEICHHDHIPFNVKGNRNVVLSVYVTSLQAQFSTDIIACTNLTFPTTSKRNVNRHFMRKKSHNFILDVQYVTSGVAMELF